MQRANDFYSRLLTADPTRTDVEAKWQKALLLATDNLLRDAVQAEQENRLADAEQAISARPQDGSTRAKPEQAVSGPPRQRKEVGRSAGAIQDPNRNRRPVQRNTERHIAEALMNLGRTEEARDILERLRNEGALDENLESKVNELEDLGRWGNEIGLFRTMEAADSLTREQLAAIIVRYFPQVAEFPQTPQIITDIQDSWARSEIQVSVGTGLTRFVSEPYIPALSPHYAWAICLVDVAADPRCLA